MLHGELAIGTEAEPHTRKATITLTDNVKGEDVMAGMGDRGIMISGGTLNLHGDRTNTWTKLCSDGQRRRHLDPGAGCPGLARRRRDRPRVDGLRSAARPSVARSPPSAATTSRSTSKLDYMHFGKITFDVDERGEVGLLTRNIKIQASADAEQSYFGGHIMADGHRARCTSKASSSTRMGQHMTLARYPIHWHLVGDGKGQYIKNASIHDTFNRCVTVHGTNYLRVENNVTYNIVGHCFFLEDGIEHGNEYVRNLAIQIKCHPTKPCVPNNLAANGEISGNRQAIRQASFSGKDTLLPSDNTVAAYWITNPDNSFIDNVAAGSDQTGFWFSLPMHPQGQFAGTEISKTIWPRRTPVRAFRGNTSHSNFDGFMIDRHINEDNTFGTGLHSVAAVERSQRSGERSAGDALREPDQLQEPQWWSLGPG